ncbi:hypothetical protein ACHAXA_009427 [Cyclostephanos tholiformis]|uniref:Glycosyltransferase family 92 protein n=1 Tax=Cyclostephanos tholiformis TaxID=382380 RepID=A0ABD3R925_9STRA
MNAKCCYLSLKRKAVLCILAVLSTVGIVITLLLAATVASSKWGGDVPSSDAPWSDGPRRNLSEAPVIDDVNRTERDDAANRTEPPWTALPMEEERPKKKEQKDLRPTGVVYEFIPPPPINATARARLRRQFPNLADLDRSALTSAALCGIVKDAEPYLDEWVDYNFGLGFHTIYLVDNSADHELRNWQDRRRNSGYSVRVIPKPGTHRQMYSYHICASEFKNDHAYMAFFDVDEYLVLKKHDTVDDFLRDHLPKGALQISWYIFGTNSRDMYSPLPVTKRFTLRDGTSESDRHPSEWHNVKAILKLSDYGQYPKSPHSMTTNKRTAGSEKAWIDTNGKSNFDSIGSVNYDRPVDIAVLHHYKYLSSKEFRWKSCTRKTVDDKYKDCDVTRNVTRTPYVGSIHDDSAWRTLKKNVPKYAAFDEFEDFM